MEISENHPDENKPRLFFSELAVRQGSQRHHLPLAETQRQTEWDSFVVDKGKGQSMCALIGDVELGAGKPEVGMASYVIG